MIFALKGLRQTCGVQGSMASGCALARPPAGFLTPHKKTGQNPVFHLAEGEGFEPPEALTSTVFKSYPAFDACHLLLLFNSPNCRKISVLTALLSDTSGFLLSFSIVPCSLVLFLFSVFLTAFCRGFVDCFARIKKFICCFILFLFLTNTRHGAR